MKPAGQFIAGERIDQDNRLAALPAQQQAARQASAIEAADARVEGQRIAASAAERTAMLDGILATPGIEDPIRVFEAQLQRQGYTMPIATATERARAQRHGDITAALGEGEAMPLPPNGMDVAALVPERTATAVPETAMAAAMRAAKARAAAAPMQPAAPAQAKGLAAELARMQAKRARHALPAGAGAAVARSAGDGRYNANGDAPLGDTASSETWAAGSGVAQPPVQYGVEANRDDNRKDVSEGDGADRRGQEGASADGNVHAPDPIPRTQAPEPAVIVQPVKRGTLRVGSEKLDTPEKAAHAFAALRKAPREYFQIIVTDKDDRPLAVYTLGMGSIAQAFVYPREVLTAIYMTPGAAKVWFAHNHPSGVPAPSDADRRVTRYIQQSGIGRDFGVTLSGHVIIAGNRAVSISNASKAHAETPFTIEPASRRYEIPILERAIRRQRYDDRPALDTWDSMIRFIKEDLKPQESGLILLDSQLRVMGWWPMTLDEMRRLRTGNAESGAGALLSMVGKFNPEAAIAYSPVSGREFRAAANNLFTALEPVDVRLVDAISQDGTSYESGAGKGWLSGNITKTMYSRIARTFRGASRARVPAGTANSRGAQAREDAKVLQSAIQDHLDNEGNGAPLPANAFTIVRMPFDAALQRLAGAFGKRVVTFRINPGAEQLAGFFEGASRLGHGDPDTIYLRADVPRPHLSILGHELAHTLAADNPALYQQLVDALKPYIRQRAYARGFASQYEGMAASGITEEFIGEVLADGFMNERFWQALGRQNPSLLNRVMGTLRSLMQRAADVIGYTPRTARYLRDFERVMELAGEAVAQYAGGNAQAGGPRFAAGARLLQRAAAALRKLVDSIATAGNQNQTVDIAPVHPDLVRDAREKAGLELSDYWHTADLYAVRHTLNQHGSEATEKNRGQLPVTANDIALVPAVIAQPDAVVYGAKNRRKQDLVATMKRMPDGTVLVVEEVRTGAKTLALASVRKVPAARDFSSIARTLLSNARSDGGAELIISPRESRNNAEGGPKFASRRVRSDSGALKQATYRERLAEAGPRMRERRYADPMALSVERERRQAPQSEQSKGPSGPFSLGASPWASANSHGRRSSEILRARSSSD